MHPISACLVGRSGNNAAFACAANHDWASTQFGPSQQLDCDKEHVHVDMEDRPRLVHLQKYDTRVPDSSHEQRPLSALPSPFARAVAFVGILLSGLAGGLIGYALVDIQCSGSCTVPTGIGLLVGAVSAAIGMAVVAVLVLRAVGEWRELQDHQQ